MEMMLVLIHFLVVAHQEEANGIGGSVVFVVAARPSNKLGEKVLFDIVHRLHVELLEDKGDVYHFGGMFPFLDLNEGGSSMETFHHLIKYGPKALHDGRGSLQVRRREVGRDHL